MQGTKHHTISIENINDAILRLKKNVSPGYDGLCAEHFIYGNSSKLRDVLANAYNIIFRDYIIPKALCSGLIIPILNKTVAKPKLAHQLSTNHAWFYSLQND